MRAAELSNSVQQSIRAATFEVGQLAATWSMQRVAVSERLHSDNRVHVIRRTESPGSLSDSFQGNWIKHKAHTFPFNGQIESESGETRVSAAVPPPGSGPNPRVLCGVEVTREDVQMQEAMTRRLELLEHWFTPLPAGKVAPAIRGLTAAAKASIISRRRRSPAPHS